MSWESCNLPLKNTMIENVTIFKFQLDYVGKLDGYILKMPNF
jgi:hypothetical protein